MYLNRFLFLLILFTVLLYECLFVEAGYNLNCLAGLGDFFVKDIARCKDVACVQERYKRFISDTKFCRKYEYKLCYQVPNERVGDTCTSQDGPQFLNLQDCESSPDNRVYIKKKCTPIGNNCHRIMCL
ncbi:uncharacterized protein BX664DRAFT_318149 [Halteromyces radiatus]|uniref:uncharacterized protein n=1 Tax=Halteromyces radiatus TaxID=101107 RepID=UPI00222060F9|nr:uncharacterized protein BX664DRAFT_318149 [Halteromyces radiatus]KAI8078807.1 hypothetical protein BX664DRAFT_318149 [Halteromyces radiatus]